MSANTLDEFKLAVATRVRLDPAVLYGHSLRLSQVIAKSPVAKNSIDLMEAVAGALAELGLDDQLELPAMTLDHTIDELVEEIRSQLAKGATLAS